MNENRDSELDEKRRQRALDLLSNLLDMADDEENLEMIGADEDTRQDAFTLLALMR